MGVIYSRSCATVTTQKRYWFYVAASIILLTVGFVCGWSTSRRDFVLHREVIFDTIRIRQPLSSKVPTQKTILTFTFPKLLFVPADTTNQTTIIDRGDSVDVVTPIEQRVYQDSTYRAWVSGPVIGNYRPSLDSLNVFQRTIVQSITPPPKILRPYATAAASFNGQAFSVGGGVLIKEKYGLGLDYSRADNKDYVLVRGVVLF